MMCGKGKWPSLSLSSWLFSRLDLLPDTHTHVQAHSQTHTLTCAYTNILEARCIQAVRTHAHTLTPKYPFFIPSFSFCLLPVQVPLQPGQSFKFTVLETLDRIKEEFQFLQAQYHRYTSLTQMLNRHSCMHTYRCPYGFINKVRNVVNIVQFFLIKKNCYERYGIGTLFILYFLYITWNNYRNTTLKFSSYSVLWKGVLNSLMFGPILLKWQCAVCCCFNQSYNTGCTKYCRLRFWVAALHTESSFKSHLYKLLWGIILNVCTLFFITNICSYYRNYKGS